MVLVFQLGLLIVNNEFEINLNFVAVTIIMSVLLLIGITGRRYEQTKLYRLKILNSQAK